MSGWVDHSAFWGVMTVHLWQSTLVIGALWACASLLRRAPARFHTALWWIAVAKLLVPASLLSGALFWVEPTTVAGRSLIRFGETLAVIPGLAGTDTELPSQAWTAGADLRWVTLAWSIGCAGLPLITWLRLRRRARQAAGVMPAVVGIVRPRVVVSERVEALLSADELAAVVLHERAHIRRRDPQRGILVLIAASLYWFFPPAWLAIGRLRAATEMACDEAVLRAGVDPATYARALARTVHSALAPATAVSQFARVGESISGRLERINAPGRFAAATHHRLVLGMAAVLMAGSSVPAIGMSLGIQDRAGRAVLWDEVTPHFRHLGGLHGTDKRVTLLYERGPTRRLARMLARRAGFEIEFEAGAWQRSDVALHVINQTIGGLLADLASYRFPAVAYRVSPDGARLTVYVPLSVGAEIAAPERVGHVAPAYPSEARRARVQGVVVLEAIVAENGLVRDARVLRGVHPDLDKAARRAVLQWQYRPTVHSGLPASVRLVVTVRFQLQ